MTSLAPIVARIIQFLTASGFRFFSQAAASIGITLFAAEAIREQTPQEAARAIGNTARAVTAVARDVNAVAGGSGSNLVSSSSGVPGSSLLLLGFGFAIFALLSSRRR